MEKREDRASFRLCGLNSEWEGRKQCRLVHQYRGGGLGETSSSEAGCLRLLLTIE